MIRNIINDKKYEAVNDNDNIKFVSNITAAAKGFPIHQCGGYLWRYIE